MGKSAIHEKIALVVGTQLQKWERERATLLQQMDDGQAQQDRLQVKVATLDEMIAEAKGVLADAKEAVTASRGAKS